MTQDLMALFDVASIVIIIKGGWIVAITSGTGAALGMIAAVSSHDRIFRKDSRLKERSDSDKLQ